MFFPDHPADRLLRPGVRRGLRSREPVRHRPGRPHRQPDLGHAAELHPGAGHPGGPQAGREAAAHDPRAHGLLQHQGQRQGENF